VQAGRYFPGREQSPECLAEAAWLDEDHWAKMRAAVANGIALAFKGP
jgi:hypothetical protein